MEETKWLTKTKLIILFSLIVLTILIVVGIFIRKNKIRNEYIQYENQLAYAASNYLLKEKITINNGEYREIKVSDILKQKLITNKRSGDCDGYVIAKNENKTMDYKAYIKCKNSYTTPGYGEKVQNSKKNTEVTQTEKDTEKPVIKLFGDEKITLTVGDTYEELKATAMDNVDGDLTDKIVISGDVDTTKAGTYTVTYTVKDSSKNKATKERIIVVEEKKEEPEPTPTPQPTPTPTPTPTPQPTPTRDTTKPIITFNNSLMQKIYTGNKADISYAGIYGYSAWDNVDGNITSRVSITGDTGIINTPGNYNLHYSVSDSSGNTTTTTRQFIVEKIVNPIPVTPSTVEVSSVTIIPNNMSLNVGATYKLSISIAPSNATDKTIKYSSTNASVVSVDSNGNIKALKKGSATIKATSNNGKVGVTYITVK